MANCFGGLLYLLCFFLWVQSEVSSETRGIEENSSIQVGVILDLKSPLGAMAEICISMAVSDFYDDHSGYRTRLELHTRDANDTVAIASSG
ncbi:Uncharacterized protein TCM_038621 [Theobroma cacao]|uniref:Uncharacterized protein n=1 Tax=Theobroma cacao TaxID=3641 RepID=A0A061GP72_THECC|nr:Uncharacterized protein TCM_038621 [Theobroma cacao]